MCDPVSPPPAVHIRTIAAFVAVCSAPPRSRSRSHAALAPDAPRVAGTASPAGFTRRQDESTQTSSPGKKFRQGKSPVETPLHNYQPICKLPNPPFREGNDKSPRRNKCKDNYLYLQIFSHFFVSIHIFFLEMLQAKGFKRQFFQGSPPPESAAEPDENGRAVPIGTARHILPPERDHPSAGPSI